MASRLELLPNDILYVILALLSRHELYNICLVSSSMTKPAQRALYRSIFLKLKAPTKLESTYRASEGNLFKFETLVDVLSQNPHIRPHVSELSIEVFHHLSNMGFKDHQRLLRLTPGLRSLTLNPPPMNFQVSNFSLPLLEELRLIFDSREEVVPHERKTTTEIMALQLWTPSLRKLVLESANLGIELRVLFPRARFGTSPVTDLEIEASSQQKVGCLSYLLSCIKALERFCLHVHHAWEGEHGPTKMSPESIAECVRPHRSTLKELEIAGSDAAEFAEAPLFGSLFDFTRLKRLAIPEPFLVLPDDEYGTLVDLLPPNLEEVQLQYPMFFPHKQDKHRGRRIKRLKQLANAKAERFPALKRVVWWMQPDECWDDHVGLRYGPGSDMEELASIFDKIGVKFQWLCHAYFDGTPFKPSPAYHDDEEGWDINADVYSLTGMLKASQL